MYHGPTVEACDYLADQGYPCPTHFNPAEHMVDIVSLDNSRLADRILVA
jgi:hypothetical protein